jgi:hypothetical protein
MELGHSIRGKRRDRKWLLKLLDRSNLIYSCNLLFNRVSLNLTIDNIVFLCILFVSSRAGKVNEWFGYALLNPEGSSILHPLSKSNG